MIKLSALLGLQTKGVDKAEKKTRKIKDNLTGASKSAAKVDKNLGRTATGAIDRQSTKAGYAGQRGATGARKAGGRNFSGLVQASRGGTGDGLGGSLVGAYAALAANVFAVTAAFQALSDAAKVEQLTQGLELMGARGGVALKATAQGLREVTDNAISTADAYRAVAQASSAGLGSEEIERLGAVARGASLALGRDASEAMDRLTRGAIKLEPELLDELGIMVRLDEAVRSYAQSQGKAASSLTLTERRQAFLNAVLDEGESKFGSISERIAANPYDKLSASVRNLGTDFFQLLNTVLKPVAQFFASNPFALLLPGIFLVQKALDGLGFNMAKIKVRTDGLIDDLIGQLSPRGGGTFLKKGFADKKYKQNLEGLNQGFNDLIKSTKGLEKWNFRLIKTTTILRARFEMLGAVLVKARVALGKLAASFAPFLILTAAFWAGGKVVQGFNALLMKMQGINKQVKEVRKGYKDLSEAALKTFEESQRLGAAEAFEARANAVKSLTDQNIKLLEAYKGQSKAQIEIAKAQELQVTFSKKIRGGKATAAETSSLDSALKQRKVSKDVRGAIAAQLALVGQLDPLLQQRAASALVTKTNEKEIVEELNKQLAPFEKILGSFKDMATASVELKKNLKDAVPREFEDASTRALSNIESIAIELQGISPKGISQGASSLAAGQRLEEIGVDALKQIKAISSEQGSILDNTIARLEEVLAIEEKINKAKAENNILALAALNAQKLIASIRLGEAGKADAAETQRITKLASLEIARAQTYKQVIAQEQKILNLKAKNLKTEQGIQAAKNASMLKAIGGSGKEGSIVSALIKENQELNRNSSLYDNRVQLLEANAAEERRLLNQTKVLLEAKKNLSAAETVQLETTNRRIGLVSQSLEQDKRALGLQLQASRSRSSNIQLELEAMATGNAARREDLKLLADQIKFEKRLMDARTAVARSRIEGSRASTDRSMGPQGITGAQRAAREKEDLQASLEQLKTQAEYLKKEHDLKLQNLALEKDIRLQELALLKSNLDSAGLDSSAIDTIISRVRSSYTAQAAMEAEILPILRANNTQQQQNTEEAIRAVTTSVISRFGEAMRGISPFRDAGTLGLSGSALAFAQDEIRNNPTQRKDILEKARAIEEATIMAEGFNNVLQSVESSVASAFEGIITGSESAKEAFKNMASAILGQIAQMIAQMLAFKVLQSATGGFIPGFANGGVIPMATGGVTDRGTMGVVNKPTYLVGEGKYNEAVVPLPNGRSIPVQMHGGNTTNGGDNVVVNVSVEGGSSTTEGSGDRAQKIGQMISSAVQRELMAQKQPGGLLSKYG